MISCLAQEIEKWIAEHHGVRPKSVRVPQAIIDACIEESEEMGFTKDRWYEGKNKGMRIRGIPVLVDPTLTIGKIDP